ncbi:hypothetical protein O6H91_18G058500 [Diphasiastrum complanatum]|uniref:Uncharacterized protein n=1 Tax=Diphasiastrum complanatum TaxID=34168 RepID=A0ACC2B1Q1_DIPCM|nr:hypothetical protein O6H91_18G058500 [Diphasiastrum complanatum]
MTLQPFISSILSCYAVPIRVKRIQTTLQKHNKIVCTDA